MAIPLFTGSVAQLANPGALDVGINSIELRGRQQGQQLAQGQRNIETSDIENQQRYIDLEQRQALAPLELRAKESHLQSEIQLDPLRAQAEELKIKEEQDQYARQVKLQQQQDQLTSIFQTGTDEQKVAAVTSGQFLEIFGANPKLEQSAIEVTYPKMSADQKSAFGAKIQNDDLRSFYQRQLGAVNLDYQGSIAEVTGDNTTSDLQRRFYKDSSLTQIPGLVKFIRSDSITRDPTTGKVTESVIPPEGVPRSYAAFDAQTNSFLTDGITPETYKSYSNYKKNRGLALQLGLPVANYSTAARTVDSLKQKESPYQEGEAVGPTAPPAPQGAPIANAFGVPNFTVQSQSMFGPAGNPRLPFTFAAGSAQSAPSEPLPAAPSANTPDTNQAPVATAQAAVLGTVTKGNPLYESLAAQKNIAYRDRAEQLNVGKESAYFPVAVDQTAQLFQNANYQPANIRSGVINRVNAEPLLADKPPLIKALAAVESAGNRNAKSPTGVRGLLQVTEATAGQYGLDRNVPEENVLAGEKELYRNLKLVRTPELALAAYNAGIGNVLDAVKATNSYDWSVVKEYLRDNLHPRKFKEVENYPEKVLNYAAAFSGTEGVEV